MAKLRNQLNTNTPRNSGGQGETSEINSGISFRACWENLAKVKDQTLKKDGS